MKPKLLIAELWGLGDLVIATPFLRAAVAQFDVTLLAKPYALDLQPRLWPGIRIVPFNAPWTAFTKKYHFWRWPLLEMFRLQQSLAGEQFDIALSPRRQWFLGRLGGDPRDLLILKVIRAKERIGFPHLGSTVFLTRSLPLPPPDAHRYESWRIAGKALGIDLPPCEQLIAAPLGNNKTVVIHSGARLPARIWPLENWRKLAAHLRAKNYDVQVVCDSDQEKWWKQNGENNVACPRSVTDLFSLIDRAGVHIGNCSGPGHLAAISGAPTFTVFGPSMKEWFAPLHPQAEWIEGKACPYKPCSDYCRFPKNFCIQDLSEEEVWPHAEKFVQKHIAGAAA